MLLVLRVLVGVVLLEVVPVPPVVVLRELPVLAVVPVDRPRPVGPVRRRRRLPVGAGSAGGFCAARTRGWLGALTTLPQPAPPVAPGSPVPGP